MAIVQVMEAATTSGTSFSFYQTTWLSIPEDSHRRSGFCAQQHTETCMEFAETNFRTFSNSTTDRGNGQDTGSCHIFTLGAKPFH